MWSYRYTVAVITTIRQLTPASTAGPAAGRVAPKVLGESHIAPRSDTGDVLLHLYQYTHEELQYDDNRTAGESQTEDAVDQDPESYFGEELDLDADTWETVEYDDSPVQRRELVFDDVTAVSRPADPGAEDPSLPGGPVQVRKEGSVEEFENTHIVEAEDPAPE